MKEWGKGGGTENSCLVEKKIDIENVICINLL